MLKCEKGCVEQTTCGKVTCKQKHAKCACMISTEFLDVMVWCGMIWHEECAVLVDSEWG